MKYTKRQKDNSTVSEEVSLSIGYLAVENGALLVGQSNSFHR